MLNTPRTASRRYMGPAAQEALTLVTEDGAERREV